MNVVFMGTPVFSCSVLKSLIETDEFDVVGVFTRQDSASGRGSALRPSPVKVLACAQDIPVFTPATLRDPACWELLTDLHPDVIVVAAYGMLLPREVLRIAPAGAINVHASLLPRWRGAAPIERAVLAGDEQTGVSIMRLVEELDAGPYCATRTVSVANQSVPELTAQLAQLGAEALIEALPLIIEGSAVWIDQDEALVTYAPKIEKSELLLDPAVDALTNARRVGASSDKSPARAIICDKTVTIIRAQTVSEEADTGLLSTKDQSANRRVIFSHKRLFLESMDGSLLEILELKPEGRRSMDASAFAAGINQHLRDPLRALWGRI